MKKLLLSCSAIGIALSAAAAAQQAQQTVLEDIVVTARKITENLQDAPVAVTAFSAERLGELRPNNLSTLSSLAPNLVISPATGAASGGNIFIRGVGAADPSPYLDSANSVYVNGVLRARTSLNLAELGDIERIEVLRGPQGTLYGRNTTGGAVNVFTPKPTQELGFKQVAGFGNHDERTFRSTLNTGAIGPVALRTSFFHREIGGNVKNPGQDSSRWAGAVESDGVDLRATATFDDLEFDYQFDWTNNRAMPYNQQIQFFVNQALFNYFNASPSFGGGQLIVAQGKLDEMATQVFPRQKAVMQGHTFTINYNLSDVVQVKSITAYREGDESRPQNSASQPLLLGRVQTAGGIAIQEVSPLQTPRRDLAQYQFSQELQLLGKVEDFSYVAGFFYFRERFHEINDNFNTAVANGIGTNRLARRDYFYSTGSVAGFGQVTWRPAMFDERLDITGGIRYTRDHKYIDDYAYLNGARTRYFTGEQSFRNTSGLVSLAYKWTPDVMTYVRLSTGYKAGGFTPGSAVGPFSPEKVKSAEIGAKTELFDRVRLNAALFYLRYNDLQIAGRVADPVTGNRVSTLTNAGKANFRGGEVEANVLLGAGFSVDGTLGFVDPKYTQFPFFDGVRDINVADEAKFPYMSRLTYDLALRYATSLPFGELSARLNYQFQGHRYFFALTRSNPNNDRIRAPGQGFLNARLSVSDIAMTGLEGLKVSFYMDNILDKDRILGSIDSTNYGSTFYGRGRQFGVELALTF